MIPLKILKLNLDSYDVAVFVAISSHGPKNIFPGYSLLMREAGNISRGRLWKSLRVLRSCNVVNWTQPSIGKSNHYVILGEGCWVKKIVDNSQKTVDKPKHQFTTRTTTSSPGVRVLVHHANPNYIQELDPITIGKSDFLKFVEKKKKETRGV